MTETPGYTKGVIRLIQIVPFLVKIDTCSAVQIIFPEGFSID
jgi:hypothetical protein